MSLSIGKVDCADVIAQFRAGDEGAAHAIYACSAEQIIALARARLGRSVAAKEDPEDVVQSVYRSFFRRYGSGGQQVANWQDVWALLVTITRRKCINRRQHYAAQRRAWSRERPLDQVDVRSDEPAPEEPVILAETVEWLLLRFPPDERAIVELSLQGYTTREISTELGRAERSVYRIREYVRDWLIHQTCEG